MARLPLVSPLDRALFLKAQPYLDGLPPNLLALLASLTEEVFFAAGERVRRSGDPIETILFFGDGAFEVQHESERGVGVYPLTAPGVVGLVDHLAQTTRPPAVRAAVDSFCLGIAAHELDQVLEDHFALVHQITRSSCDSVVRARMRDADSRQDEPGFDAPELAEPAGRLDLVQRLARTRRAPLFQGANLTLLAELIKLDEPDRIAKGEFLWREGDPIDRMALVFEGHFRSHGRYGVARAGPGATVGAFEIAGSGTRFEGWVAETCSRVLFIERELFIDLLEDHFELAQLYLRRLSCEVAESIRRRALRDASDRVPQVSGRPARVGPAPASSEHTAR